ncbi:MAG: cytochrome d ubiquinol oxidase subunit II [bacterium]
MSGLQVAWFIMVGFFIAGYAILDGFDLGVGFWHLFARKDSERRLVLNAIGPVWDGNEVWLLAIGGCLFASFPPVYATVFSGFYLAFMLVIFALIFRATAIVFRSEHPSKWWRSWWDGAFAFGSVIPSVFFGVALGNLLRGLPLDDAGNYTGTFADLLNPYSLLIGFTGFAMVATHGALYLVLKTEGGLADRARGWAQKMWVFYLVLFLIAGAVTLVAQPQLIVNYNSLPILWIIPALTLAAIVMLGVFNMKGEAMKAFYSSIFSIIGLISLSGSALFPNLVPSLDNPQLSLNIMNASSSPLTLKAMLVITLLGMPVVIVYTVWIYTAFGGKVKLDEAKY